MTTDELKSCPFCGSDAELIDHTGLLDEGWAWGECKGCGACGSHEIKAELAKEMWNKRIDDPLRTHRDMVSRIPKQDRPGLVIGESGTGRDLTDDD